MSINDRIKESQKMECDNYACGHRGKELEMCYFDVYPLCQYYNKKEEKEDEYRKRDNRS